MPFAELQEIDARLLTLPLGDEAQIAALIERRAALLAGLPRETFAPADAEELAALAARTEAITARLAHLRRLLAEESAAAARHRRLLDTLEATLPRPSSTGIGIDL